MVALSLFTGAGGFDLGAHSAGIEVVRGVELDPHAQATATAAGLPCQRWSERQARYRPAGERITPSRYTVAAMSQAPARAFVQVHHYMGSWPAVRLSVGLYDGARLVGVAAFGVPAQPKVLTSLCAGHEGVEISRLVLLDSVPGDGESWFTARAMRIARDELEVNAIISYSDPLPRTTIRGAPVTPGHVGIVYQALNAEYLGLGSPRTLYLDDDGRAFSPRTLSKIKAQDKGARAAERELVNRGAEPRRPGEAPADYLTRALSRFRMIRHPGCHRYLWRWDARGRRIALPLPWSFPRQPAQIQRRVILPVPDLFSWRA